MTVYYEIRVKGHLDSRWAPYFEGMDLSLLPNGETLLSGPLADQAALHCVLTRIRDLGLPLLLVTRLTQLPSSSVPTGEGPEEEGD